MKISLRSARETKGYTINEIAEKLSVSARYLKFLEDNPSLVPAPLALRLSAIYHISVDYIFFE
ncbi:MAG: helix-turn-helix transcriptional regulator [Clostridia bacterium]|nr:helix-turn-helix transcriptional regulator [Clostridia bacterium]